MRRSLHSVKFTINQYINGYQLIKMEYLILVKYILDSCKIYTNNNESVECEEHVFDKSVYWGVTLNEQVSIIVDRDVVVKIFMAILSGRGSRGPPRSPAGSGAAPRPPKPF